MLHHFQTIEKAVIAEHKDRGSRFLAYAFPIISTDDFKKQLKSIKDQHPKAAHHCFAYRIGINGTLFRTNDDGEPSGTAGKPILGQLDSKNLTNTAVVVVRYFGGTLLGVPGLIQAYKTATSLALQLTPIVQKPVLVEYELQFDYTLLNEVMLIVKRINCIIATNEMQLFCILKIGVPKDSEAQLLERIKDLSRVEIKKVK